MACVNMVQCVWIYQEGSSVIVYQVGSTSSRGLFQMEAIPRMNHVHSRHTPGLILFACSASFSVGV